MLPDGLVSEVKVVAFVDFAGVQAASQDVMRELVRSHQRQIAREGKQAGPRRCRSLPAVAVSPESESAA